MPKTKTPTRKAKSRRKPRKATKLTTDELRIRAIQPVGVKPTIPISKIRKAIDKVMKKHGGLGGIFD